MNFEKMEVLGFNVENIEKAEAFLSGLFNIEFKRYRMEENVFARFHDVGHVDTGQVKTGARVSIDAKGFFELIETPASEVGIRNIHFKVDDIEAAKAWMADKGMKPVTDVTVGGLREVVYPAKDFFGIRLCLVQYQTPTVIEAVLEGAKF